MEMLTSNKNKQGIFLRGLRKPALVLCSLVTAVLLFAGFVIVRGSGTRYYAPDAKLVRIVEKHGRFQFYKSGQPFEVKGAVGNSHLEELAASGGNTITCWDLKKLDSTMEQAQRLNLSVIIGLDLPPCDRLDFYKNADSVSGLLYDYKKIVYQYKNHSSLLAYCVGNELLFPFSLTNNGFYNSYNRIIETIKNTDGQHPVTTSVMNVGKKNIANIQWHTRGLDFLSINTYNRLKTLQQDLGAIKLIWKGPYLVSEWGPNGGWEAETTKWEAPIENTSTRKAALFSQFYKDFMPVKDPRFLGSLAFYWGPRNEYTPTWYGVFNETGKPTEVREALADCWRGIERPHLSPRLQYMLVDGLGARDNVVLTSGSVHHATVLLEKGQPSGSIRYEWKILKEGWTDWGKTWKNFRSPEIVNSLVRENGAGNVEFEAPAREGIYRIFVTAYNDKGLCATANTPLYVIAN